MDEPAPALHDPTADLAAHVLAKVGLGFVDDGAGPLVALDPAPVLLDGDGHVAFGVLGILFDLASSTAFAADAMRPFVHADITVHRLRPPSTPMVASARAVRQGGRTGVVEIDLHDRAGALVATSTQEIVFKGGEVAATPRMTRMREAFRSMFDGTCRLTRPLEQDLGIAEGPAGTWSLALRPERTNGFGGLHGGIATTLVDVAASGAVAARHGAARTVSAAVRYLAPAMHGPFLARPEVVLDAGGVAVVRVPVVDTGDGDRLVILADTHVAPG